MAPPLDRTWYNTLIDDDGSGTVGTIWNKGQIDGLLDTVDVSLAGLVDKTGDSTQTGLTTFDRDPDAPFAVTPGSAVVPNLDADKLDGLHASAFAKLSGTGVTNQIAVFQGADSVRGDAAMQSLGNGLLIRATAPMVGLLPVGGTPDARRWSLYVDDASGSVLLAPMSDAGGGQSFPFQITRSGQLNITKINVATNIQFPAGYVDAPDPNTLDDYREGTFTPAFQSSGGQSGQTYQPYTNGIYVRVGRVVTAIGRIGLTSLGTFGAGAMRIAGLPFTPAIQACASITLFSNLTIPVASLGGLSGAGAGGTIIDLYYTLPGAGAGSSIGLPNTAMNAATDLIFSVSYFT